MKSRKIAVKKAPNQLSFYLIADNREYYLFTQDFSLSLYRYFRRTVTEHEVLSFRGWHKNPLLDHMMEKLPAYIRYADKELIPAAPAVQPRRSSKSKTFKYVEIADAYDFAA